ncbi:MAG: phenylalanine--tRNA ligase subunit beta [Candidatus Omnitrophota bacterium]
MLVTYDWLKDFVEIRLSPQALAEKLTMAGLEVTSLENRGGEVILEIEITANRPDLLSVAGIAREVAAITGRPFKSLKPSSPRALSLRGEKPVRVNIESKKDCSLYTAKVIKDVEVGPSPDWLRKRLERVGCRSVNNIVDITNYCLFAWGEPLHAFDLDKLKDSAIEVRRAEKNEKLVTLDGLSRTLSSDILVIADSRRPIAIAGVMGGKDTEVTEGTKNILLEAAVFDPIIVRHGRQALGLQTDSSYRFERGVDFETAGVASWQAVAWIRTLAKGRYVSAKSVGFTRRKKKTVGLSLSRVQKLLNIPVKAPRIKSILHRLGFTVKRGSKDKWCVLIPAFRPDVQLEIDLIEEIARIEGFQQIPKTLPRVAPEPFGNRVRDLVYLTKNIMTGLGLNEVVTYSLMDKGLLHDLGLSWDRQPIEILNPLSKEQEILRPTLLASLAQCVAFNLNQKQEYIPIFEVAQAFVNHPEGPKEELRLGLALCGSRSFVLEDRFVKDPADFLHFKGILEALFGKMGIAEFQFTHSALPSSMDIHAGKERIGLMMMLGRKALERLGIKNKNVFLLELSLEKLFSLASLERTFAPLPKYPGITRDISFLLKNTVSVRELLDALLAQGQPLLCSIQIVDFYKGKQIPSGYKGLTISCLYRSEERTLTETEISPVHTLLCSTLTDRFAAKIR